MTTYFEGRTYAILQNYIWKCSIDILGNVVLIQSLVISRILHLLLLDCHSFNFLFQQSNLIGTSLSESIEPIETIESLTLPTATYLNLIVAICWHPCSSCTCTRNITTVLIAVKATLLSTLKEQVVVVGWAYSRGNCNSVPAYAIRNCRSKTWWPIAYLLTGHICWRRWRRAKYSIKNGTTAIYKATKANQVNK